MQELSPKGERSLYNAALEEFLAKTDHGPLVQRYVDELAALSHLDLDALLEEARSLELVERNFERAGQLKALLERYAGVLRSRNEEIYKRSPFFSSWNCHKQKLLQLSEILCAKLGRLSQKVEVALLEGRSGAARTYRLAKAAGLVEAQSWLEAAAEQIEHRDRGFDFFSYLGTLSTHDEAGRRALALLRGELGYDWQDRLKHLDALLDKIADSRLLKALGYGLARLPDDAHVGELFERATLRDGLDYLIERIRTATANEHLKKKHGHSG